MWLVMRGALSASVREVHSAYCLPSMTGIGTLVLEDLSQEVPAAIAERHRQSMAVQLAGAGALPGTHPFTHQRSVKAYRLNRFLHDLVHPANREAFRRDERAACEAAGLTAEEQGLVQRRDWRGMIHYGVIFFMLEKLGAVLGISNLEIYAAMRGDSLEAFLATRNTKVQYSVAGREGLSRAAQAAAGSAAASPAQPETPVIAD
jgi:gallate dioxygenase